MYFRRQHQSNNLRLNTNSYALMNMLAFVTKKLSVNQIIKHQDYSRFSCLVYSNFDQAVIHFADSSISLLYYEVVKHNYHALAA